VRASRHTADEETARAGFPHRAPGIPRGAGPLPRPHARPPRGGTRMAKGERWQLRVDYVETCNCDFGCPCNFSGYPTDGFCEALVAYHIRDGRFGKVKLDNLDVVYAAAWPKAIHQGGGTLRLYFSQDASAEQRDALLRIFSGQAKGSGPFELFAGTMATIEEPVGAPIE